MLETLQGDEWPRVVDQNWQQMCSGIVKEIGFTIGKVLLCHYTIGSRTRVGWRMATTSCSSARKHLQRIAGHMKNKFNTTWP